MFGSKSEKEIEFNQFKNYLKDKNYQEINLLTEYYNMACQGLLGVSFQKNKKLILQVLKVISNYEGQNNFEASFTFAEELLIAMEINLDNENEVYDYLGTLNTCLANNLTDSSKAVFDLCILFENKKIVQAILKAMPDESTEVIRYIKEARQYYVDERALYSSVLNLIIALNNSNDADAIITSFIEKDRQNAGVYTPDEQLQAFFEIKNGLPDLLAKFAALKVDTEKIEKRVTKLKQQVDKTDGKLTEEIKGLEVKVSSKETAINKRIDQMEETIKERLTEIKRSLKAFNDEASKTFILNRPSETIKDGSSKTKIIKSRYL